MSNPFCAKCGCEYDEETSCACDDIATSAAIAQALRESIQRQVDTTQSGQRLVAFDAAAVQNLVDNLVGNVLYLILEIKNS